MIHNLHFVQNTKYKKQIRVLLAFTLFLCSSISSYAQIIITTQPAAQTVCAGSAATFSVVATGTVAGYQWF